AGAAGGWLPAAGVPPRECARLGILALGDDAQRDGLGALRSRRRHRGAEVVPQADLPRPRAGTDGERQVVAALIEGGGRHGGDGFVGDVEDVEEERVLLQRRGDLQAPGAEGRLVAAGTVVVVLGGGL